MKTVPAMITALVAMATPVAAFTTPQTASRIFGLGAIPDGWVGGFPESNPAYAYPQLEPDLSDLPILDNMANIDLLTRQQKVLWPQFSWLTIPGDESEASRCYQMFAPDISRLGYDDSGRVYSIICPQQGFFSALLGSLNVEVTVTGTRGWVNEPGCTVYADMGVKGRVWITKPNSPSKVLDMLEGLLDAHNFPFSKEHSINVTTHNPGQPWNPLFSLVNGTDSSFRSPLLTEHWDEAYGVGYLNVQIGEVEKTGDEHVDKFNQMIIDIFNLGSGNIFDLGSILTWNVWFDEPELVDKEEWASHAALWRESLDKDGKSPMGEGSEQTYYDGTVFKPFKASLHEELKFVSKFIKWIIAKKEDKKEEQKEDKKGLKASLGAKKSEALDSLAHFFAGIDFDRFQD